MKANKAVFFTTWILYLVYQSGAVEDKGPEDINLCQFPDMFHCDDNNVQCIDESKKCNGVSECHSGLDESIIVCGCQPEEFQCNTTVCIDLLRRCDLHEDCEDGEDEEDCDTYICPPTHFKCSNHFCVPRELSCNYHDDCGDNSDEATCHYRECRYSEWRCNNSECLSTNAYLCDGVEDCRDGSDERDCEKHFIMANGLYVSKEHRCDGWPYYRDVMTDEENCGPCQEDQFQCLSHRCISTTNVCDGICDCGYNCDDERNCTGTPCLIGEWFFCGLVPLKSTPRCIRPQHVCDGINDCRDSDDGFDEYCNYTSLCRGLNCPDDRCAIYEGSCSTEPKCVSGEDHRSSQCSVGICHKDQFTCDNGQCVNMTSRCDAAYDCRDLSDEKNCSQHRCPEGKRSCRSGQCIAQDLWCDFFRDCIDGSDENTQCYKSATCEPGEFRCDNGQCIDQAEKCLKGVRHDGRPTGCADESHLLRCKNYTCRPGEFKCRNSYCVPSTARCNDYPECLNTLTDEMGCPYPCPYPETTCTCRDSEMDCAHRTIQHVPDVSNEKGLSKFLLSGNNIGNTLDNTTFTSLSELTYVDLTNNNIRNLGYGYFRSLWRLTTLILEDNQLTELKRGAFLGLLNLNTLYLRGNRIEYIESQAFAGMSSLKALDLSQQRIKDIPEMAFIGLKAVYTLNLSRNVIVYIADGAFNGMPDVKLLDISGNRIITVGDNVFNGLQRLSVMHTDEFRFCCLAPGVAKCFPEPDEFSSCHDLMSNYVLRISIWVLGTISLVGNTLVIIWRCKDARDSKVHSFLITNLAVGDMLMGIYLLVIAAVDLYYRGVYIQYEHYWKHSVLCKFAGFLSTFSSELSVFTLTVITVDRFVAIIFPFRFKRLDMRDASIVMASMWIMVILLAVIPLTNIDYFRDFYGRSGVCLALHITPHRPSGWEYAVFIFLAMNCFSFVVIFVSYIWMFVVAKRTRAAARSPEMRKDHAMARRMTLIVLTDFCCWIPIIILGCASLGGATIPPQVFAWIAVFVLPLNAAVNPVLYTLSTASFLGLARNRASQFRRSVMSTISGGDTKTFVFDDPSSAYEKIRYSATTATNKSYQAMEMTKNPRRKRGDSNYRAVVPNETDKNGPSRSRKRVDTITVTDTETDGLVPDVIYLYNNEQDRSEENYKTPSSV